MPYLLSRIKLALSYSLKLTIIVLFLLTQLSLSELFLCQNNIINTDKDNNILINTAHADTTDPWYSNNYTYRKKITIDHTKVSHTGATNNLSNFPVLINIQGDPSLISSNNKVRNDFNDVIFVNQADNQPLNYEVESYDSGSGNILVWVKIPTLYDSAAAQDSIIYMYYGYPTATPNTTANKQGVWDDGGGGYYKGVWHVGESGTGAVGDYKDSTANGNNSTNTSSEPTKAAGQIGEGQSFDGSTNIASTNNSSLNITDNITVSAWVNISSLSATVDDGIVGKCNFRNGYALARKHWSSHLSFTVGDGSTSANAASTQDLVAGQWAYLVGTATANGSMYLYKNGVQIGTGTAGIIVNSGNTLKIGDDEKITPGHFHGSIDEVRVSNIARSADWISTEFTNQSDATPDNNFIKTLSSEENSTPPQVTGVIEGSIYNTNKTITFNKGTATLNGQNFTTGSTVSTPGTYTLIVTDIAGTVTIHFTISSSSSPFTPPIKPNIDNVKSFLSSNTNILSSIPNNIYQIAVSTSQDFKNVSWELFNISKLNTIKQTANTLYLKFRTNKGASSDMVTFIPQQKNTASTILKDGDIVKLINNPDIYIIKYINNKQYKRLILSPKVFKSYGHLKWSNIKIISQQELDTFIASNLVKVKNDNNIYILTPEGDIGKRQVLDITKVYDKDSIYEINTTDRDSYRLSK